MENNEINFETITQMNPLKEGATFKGIISFHNLKPEELGAILSALTFHGREKECKHSLGQAKSQGYGSVSVIVDELTISQQKKEIKEYLDAYEKMMNEFLQVTGKKTPGLVQYN